MTLEVTLYTRKNCKLCDQAEADLHALQKDIPHHLIKVDIDTDPDLVALYGHKVPVVAAGPFTLGMPFDKRKLRMTLGAAKDSREQWLEDDEATYTKKEERRKMMTTGDRVSHFIAGHYLTVLNLILAIYVGLPFLAPVLMKIGLPGAAQPIYSVYKVACHELAFRSWFLFGEQAMYPREAAGLDDIISYGEATGYNEEDLITARNFQGNEQMGYKVALCERDVAIYGAMLLFGLLFGLTGRKLKSLPLLVWLIVGIVPIGLDGVSQLLSQLNLSGIIQMFDKVGMVGVGRFLSVVPYRESTPLLRTITGALFGFTTGWFGFPVFEETMGDTRRYLAAKRARITSQESAEPR